MLPHGFPENIRAVKVQKRADSHTAIRPMEFH